MLSKITEHLWRSAKKLDLYFRLKSKEMNWCDGFDRLRLNRRMITMRDDLCCRYFYTQHTLIRFNSLSRSLSLSFFPLLNALTHALAWFLLALVPVFYLNLNLLRLSPFSFLSLFLSLSHSLTSAVVTKWLNKSRALKFDTCASFLFLLFSPVVTWSTWPLLSLCLSLSFPLSFSSIPVTSFGSFLYLQLFFTWAASI